MKTTGKKAAVLTNLFGGSVNNEGLGLFSLSFDWQYVRSWNSLRPYIGKRTNRRAWQITSFQTALPLKLQIHQNIGFVACFIAMIGIYYGNGWDSRSLPFMSTELLMHNGSSYPAESLFPNGVLDEAALAHHGVPKLTGSFAYGLFMANAAVGFTFPSYYHLLYN